LFEREQRLPGAAGPPRPSSMTSCSRRVAGGLRRRHRRRRHAPACGR
jgi:hypothetical protein